MMYMLVGPWAGDTMVSRSISVPIIDVYVGRALGGGHNVAEIPGVTDLNTEPYN